MLQIINVALKPLHKLHDASYFFIFFIALPHSEAISVPRELAAKDSAALVRAFQSSAAPFLARVMVFITSHTGALEHVGSEVFFTIVVVKRAVIFFCFFFPLQTEC